MSVRDGFWDKEETEAVYGVHHIYNKKKSKVCIACAHPHRRELTRVSGRRRAQAQVGSYCLHGSSDHRHGSGWEDQSRRVDDCWFGCPAKLR
jgi:hypothetical protein